MLRAFYSHCLSALCLSLTLHSVHAQSPSATHPAKAAKPVPQQSNDWINLFNGKDFTHWGAAGETKHLGYIVKDGVIESTPECSYLFTDQSFKNYILDLKFQLTPGANNGLGFHYPGEGDPSWVGMELQVLDNSAEKWKNLKVWQYHGSLYSIQAAERGYLKPVGEWNEQRVIVSGDMVSVILNGKLIMSASLSKAEKDHPDHKGSKRREGHIVFCGHKDVVRYKDIKILPF